jgi:Transcriptional regulators
MADTRRAWEVVLETIETQLLSGRLKPGDHLPPERTLAAELEVGRSSVREAIRVLEVLGLVRTATGSGPQAGAIIVATPQGGMSALMRLQVAAQGFPVADVVRTRLLLETAVAADLASARATDPSRLRHFASDAPAGWAQSTSSGATGEGTSDDDALGAARQLLDAMDSPALTPAEFLALDARFHVALAEASGNLVVTAMMAGLRNSIEGYVLAGVPALPNWADTVTRLRMEHRGIVAAIDRADAALARTLTHDHIASYYAESRLTATASAASIPASTPPSIPPRLPADEQ